MGSTFVTSVGVIRRQYAADVYSWRKKFLLEKRKNKNSRIASPESFSLLLSLLLKYAAKILIMITIIFYATKYSAIFRHVLFSFPLFLESNETLSMHARLLPVHALNDCRLNIDHSGLNKNISCSTMNLGIPQHMIARCQSHCLCPLLKTFPHDYNSKNRLQK